MKLEIFLELLIQDTTFHFAEKKRLDTNKESADD
jgi:hypothetical protein